tara:strand:- start:255 stop:1163 length:909 start_codon:yes stop_codon:yes gene_type:complete
MKVGIFLNSANDPVFRALLYDVQWGITEAGGDAFVTQDDDDIDICDVAVIFGSWKDRNTAWHNCKRVVVESGKPFICIETPLIGRGPVSNILQDDWYRIGVNGFLADTGRFYRQNQSYPSDRWEKISKNLNVKLQPWKKEGTFIVIALQLPGDASLRGINVTKWAADSAEELRTYTDRPIVVRTPQLDRQFDKENIVRITRIEGAALQQGTKDNLLETLDAAYATVTYSSGFGIDSVIRGTPTIAMDPGNFAYSLGNNKLSQIEDLVRSNDRQQWLNNLSYAQWSRKEIKDGRAWQHIRNQL